MSMHITLLIYECYKFWYAAPCLNCAIYVVSCSLAHIFALDELLIERDCSMSRKRTYFSCASDSTSLTSSWSSSSLLRQVDCSGVRFPATKISSGGVLLPQAHSVWLWMALAKPTFQNVRRVTATRYFIADWKLCAVGCNQASFYRSAWSSQKVGCSHCFVYIQSSMHDTFTAVRILPFHFSVCMCVYVQI